MLASANIVQPQVRGRRQWLSLIRLPHSIGQSLRYRHVLYHSGPAERVDVVVYRERGFQEAWFLVVPPDSESWLPAQEAVRPYRQHLQIEQCSRDWKSHVRAGVKVQHLGRFDEQQVAWIFES